MVALTYNSTTGVLTSIGPSASEVRAHNGGTGVTYNSPTGVIAITQAVETSDDVTFNSVTADVTGGDFGNVSGATGTFSGAVSSSINRWNKYSN